MKGKILIIDDNKSVLTALEMLLQEEFKEVFTLKSPNNLVSFIQQNAIDTVLLDMNFKAGINTGNEGLYWLQRIHEVDPTISVVMITAHGDVELAVKAVKQGAFDFVLKPWDNNKLIATLTSSLEMRKSKQETAQLREKTKNLKNEINTARQAIIGQSPAMQKVMALIQKVAVTDANILITGENGTGKELVAREIHRLSLRSSEVMVTIDMGSISETLFESELFGHVKGSFTDAKENRSGKFETAHKGSLFLDEIGNLPQAMQAKLLAALQNRTITRIGSNTPIPIDIRLIAATNKNLDDMVANGTFRQDLLYRINTIHIEIPPLRERCSDIYLLAHFYLDKYARKYNKPGLKISQEAIEKLNRYHWPGNVRELQHAVEKAVILSEQSMIMPHDFALRTEKSIPSVMQGQTIDDMEKQMILAQMDKEKGNLSNVAKNLGVTRQTLYNKLKKYNI
jgi:DNA-binding NtrC family response regulator